MTRRAFFALAMLPWLPKPMPHAKGPLTVVVNNYSNAKRMPLMTPGRRQLEVLIKEATREGLRSGRFDAALVRLYGRRLPMPLTRRWLQRSAR